MKEGFKRTVFWNKYKSEVTTQWRNNSLYYMINIKRLLVLSFRDGGNKRSIDYFDKYYMSLVEIKCFNILIDNKPFFDQPVKANIKLINNLPKCQDRIIT